MREDWDKGRGPGSKLGGQDTIGMAGMLAGRRFFLRGVGGRGLGQGSELLARTVC